MTFSVQKLIQEKERNCAETKARFDKVVREKEKKEKRWKQLKEATKHLLEERDLMENRFKQEQASIDEQKAFFPQQLKKARSILTSNLGLFFPTPYLSTSKHHF